MKTMRKYEPVKELVAELTGWTPSAGTISRWRNELGLHTIRLANRICANREDLIEFLERQPEKSANSDKPRSEASTAKALEHADKELTELGI